MTGAGASPTISSTSIRNNSGAGLSLTSAATATLTGLTMTGNGGFAISQDPGVTIAAASGLVATGNGTNAIELRSGSVATSTTWKKLELSYVATGNVTIEGGSNPVLTIEPGVTVKFSSGRGLFVGSTYSGGLQAVGTAADPITFTSSAAAPRADLAVRPLLQHSPPDEPPRLRDRELAGIRRERRYLHRPLLPTLENVTITDSSGTGITVTGAGANPTISGSSVASNATAGISVAGGAPPLPARWCNRTADRESSYRRNPVIQATTVSGTIAKAAGRGTESTFVEAPPRSPSRPSRETPVQAYP